MTFSALALCPLYVPKKEEKKTALSILEIIHCCNLINKI
jgi:hypothetical protein